MFNVASSTGRVEPTAGLLQRLRDYYLALDAADNSPSVTARPSGRDLPPNFWGRTAQS